MTFFSILMQNIIYILQYYPSENIFYTIKLHLLITEK